MNLLTTIFPCFTAADEPIFTDKAPSAHSAKITIIQDGKSSTPTPTEEALAEEILSILLTADKRSDIHHQLKDHVQAASWTATLARRVLDGLVNALNSGAVMGGAMKEAFDKVSAVAESFVREHPILMAVIVTIIAIGILEMLMPWAIAALGFGEAGPVEGKSGVSGKRSDELLIRRRLVCCLVAIYVSECALWFSLCLASEAWDVGRKVGLSMLDTESWL
jgi:hypothetical protein